MAFTDIFIKRPVLSTVLSLLILLAGLQAISSLNVREYPDVQSSVISVNTVYPGADAELIRGFITTPLEREIASADGIDYISSSSTQSLSTITVKLRLDYDPNEALTQILTKVNRVRGELPQDSEDPIVALEVGHTTAAMYMSFRSDSLSSNQITDYLLRVVQPKISTVPGVQKADILGARTFAMRVWIKPEKLTAYDISSGELRNILASQNYLSAVGKTKGAWTVETLTANTDMRTVDEFKNLVVKDDGDVLVRLKDVADVVLGAEDYDTDVKMGTQNATFMGVSVLPTANVLEVIAGVREILPEIESQLPEGLQMLVPYDSTEYIEDSIHEVIKTLVEAVLIVIFVIYLFLGSFRSVLIPVIAIPLSLIGGIFLMLLMGFSINLLTLLAMVMAIGIVVDDAIVMVENIHRYIEEGMEPLPAALKGAKELVGPVIAMTITLMAVFAPIGLQTGLTGILFKEFAFTLAGAVMISGVVALTLSPMLSSKVLRHEKPTGLAHKVDVLFDRVREGYRKLLGVVLANRRSVYAVAAILLVALVPLYSCSQKELAPTEDRGFIMAFGQSAPNSSIETTQHYVNQTLQRVAANDATAYIFGISGAFGANSGIVGWVLNPWSERDKTSMELLPFMQQQLASTTGLKGGASIPAALPGSSDGMPVQFVVCSTEDPKRVAEVADAILARAMQTGKFYYGDADLKFDMPQSEIVVDRDKAADMGILMRSISADLGTMLGGGYINRFTIDGRSYKVIPQVTRSQRLNPEQLANYYIRNGNGKLVPLSTIAKVEQTVQPRSLARFQQLNASTISLLPANGVSLGDALELLEGIAAEEFPQGYTADYNGELRQYVDEGSSLLVTFGLAVVVIYLVLAAQYESFRDPFVILMTVPLAILGALVFIYLGATTINIYTQIGFITLVGLITKNGILIVEFANQLRAEGKRVMEAVIEASAIRLRPIMMTTLATVFGVFPLLMAHGPGAVSRFSMGLVIATGMTIGTLFTLFVVPAFYMLVNPEKKEIEKTQEA